MANVYALNELADMHYVYGEARGNAHTAAQIYRERYPGRRHPHHSTFQTIHQRLRETGTLVVHKPDSGARRTRRTVDFEDEVLHRIRETPSTSTRAIARAMGTNHVSVWQVLQDEGLHPFHVLKVQCLTPLDFGPRMQFCNWVSERQVEQPDFFSKVLFTDEAYFTREGVVLNQRNSHIWERENPFPIRERGYQHRFSVNIWAGIIANYIIGPYLLPPRLDGHVYEQCLIHVLPTFLEDVPLDIRRQMWIQHDGAPAHFDRNVRNHLDNVFPGRWIGRGGPVAWPPRSPDLTPPDFFLWGHLKSLVYQTPVDSDEELLARILAACDEIRDTPGIFEGVRASFLRRCNLCLLHQGQHFEQYL